MIKKYKDFLIMEAPFNLDKYGKGEYIDAVFSERDKEYLRELGFDEIGNTYANMIENQFLIRLSIYSNNQGYLKVYHTNDKGDIALFSEDITIKFVDNKHMHPPYNLIDQSIISNIARRIHDQVPLSHSGTEYDLSDGVKEGKRQDGYEQKDFYEVGDEVAYKKWGATKRIAAENPIESGIITEVSRGYNRSKVNNSDRLKATYTIDGDKFIFHGEVLGLDFDWNFDDML